MVCRQMREYDFIFSLGFCCTVSESLRAEGLQQASFPFDWAGISSLDQTVSVLEDDFAGWFDRELLDLWDVRITGGFVTRVYRNRKTGVGFVHDFSNAEPIESTYETVRERYERRIERLRQCLKASGRILAVYLEVPKSSRLSDRQLAEAHRRLNACCPGKTVDLLYLYEDPDCPQWTRDESSPDGVTAVKMDYRTFLNGELMHLCRHDQVRACVRSLASLANRESDEARAEFAAAKRRELKRVLGKSRFEQWMNKKLRQWFRDLECYLEKQRLIPGDRPLWFDGDGK